MSATIDTEGLSGNAPRPMEDTDDRADFLFGGWSWCKQQFYVRRISYNPGTKSFEPTEEIPKGDINAVTFLGDNLKEATEKLHNESRGNPNFGAYNMEPLLVLARMTRGEFPDIGGHCSRSGLHEFFGVKTLSGQYAVQPIGVADLLW